MGIERRLYNVELKDRIKGLGLMALGAGTIYLGTILQGDFKSYNDPMYAQQQLFSYEKTISTFSLNGQKSEPVTVQRNKEAVDGLNNTADNVIAVFPFIIMGLGAVTCVQGVKEATNLTYRR